MEEPPAPPIRRTSVQPARRPKEPVEEQEPAREPARRSAASQRRDPPLPVLEKIENNFLSLDINHYFSVEYNDIAKAVSELPIIIEYINEALQRAQIASMKAKWDIEALEAETYTRVRQSWAATYAEKMTENAVSMVVAQDPDLEKARNNYAVVKSFVSRLQNTQENLRTRLDCQRSVEATRRRLVMDDPQDDR